MTSDETIHGADVVMKAIAREAAHHSAASFPAIFDALGRYHRALAEAGLLAPAPLREEWACRYTLRSGKVKTRREATERAAREWIGTGEGEPAILRRYVSDWETP